jgi:microcompartment protein CcmK/EutM
MILARVVGNVVATRKHDQLVALKLLMVQPVDLENAPSGDEFLAADAVGAGAGERVLVVIEGKSACQALDRTQAPLDASIIGIVDRIELGNSSDDDEPV